MNPVELEIGLHNWDKEKHSYSIEMRSLSPGDLVENRLIKESLIVAVFDLQTLHTQPAQSVGKQLTEALFADPEVKKAFLDAKKKAMDRDEPLRVRLFINPNAQELHGLPWESLCDPEDLSPLFTSDLFFFSRYIISSNYRPFQGDGRLKKALLVVANPQNLDKYAPNGQKLTPIDVAGEIQRVLPGLRPFETSILDNKQQEVDLALTSHNISNVHRLSSNDKSTIDNLFSCLREGFDILYLVCHGAMVDSHPKLWLEDQTGVVSVVSGIELVERLKGLKSPPKLIVLASCQSGGTATDTGSTLDPTNALSALGLRLADAGIPAVVAMQGSVKMKTIAEFIPTFFSELKRDGILDQAMSIARREITDLPERAIPVLYMRLKNGSLRKGSALTNVNFEGWDEIITPLNDKKCTVILGFGLLESFLPSTRDLAKRWAEIHHFPLATNYREDLPQVAQFIKVQKKGYYLRSEFIWTIKQELQRRFPELKTQINEDASLNQLLHCILTDSKYLPSIDKDPHYLLAQLKCPVYISAKPDDLMKQALISYSRSPLVLNFEWKDELDRTEDDQLSNPPKNQQSLNPSIEYPLVYNLFGSFDDETPLVLAEDDYFDYLIKATGKVDPIPAAVRGRLNHTLLLFLGFRLDEWSFRALLRSLLNRAGEGSRKEFAHVAVQIDPQYSHNIEPDQARNYLRKYFHASHISVYEGSVNEFVAKLHEEGINKYGSKFLVGKKVS